jgi:hypothetical protein
VKRVHVLVEGQTEETFVRDVLGPHLLTFQTALHVTIISTKKIKAGGKFRGGVTGYPQVRRELRNLLEDTGAAAVTTMIDYYALPDDFPGQANLPKGGTCYRRAEHLEGAFHADIPHQRFLPYLSLHEFESLLLVLPEEIGRALPKPAALDLLKADVAGFASPEEVNDGPTTHPSERIRRSVPGYQKRLHGPLIAARIGLQAIRESCPHFAAWLRRLEELPATPQRT